MAYPKSTRELIRTLRSKGMTYSEIFNKTGLRLSKSTVSLWCKDIPLPSWYPNKVEELNRTSLQRAQAISRASRKRDREILFNDLRECNRHVKEYRNEKEVLKLALGMLYLGEGAKWKSHRGLMLGSSDARIVTLYIQLLYFCYGIEKKNLKCRVCYRADQDTNQLENYWSKVTGIPLGNFYKTKPDIRTVGIPTRKKDYRGVCVVTCAGTRIQLELDIISELTLESLTGGPIA